MIHRPGRRTITLLAAGLWIAFFKEGAAESSAERGKYIFDAAGCFACHTDTQKGGPALAGGPPLRTPFGVFFAPNITPDPTHGIGRWSDQQFLRAMREGRSPDGRHYYPAFPYTTYTRESDQDLLDLKAYLFSVPPVATPSRPHELSFPFSIRALLGPWKWLNFTAERWTPNPARDEVWNRGSYLVEALSHCGECHTPRNPIGGLDHDQHLAGAPFLGDGGGKSPNLTPHPSGLAAWSEGDLVFALEFGVSPEGGAFTGAMSEVVRFSTSKLTPADRKAMALYLKSLPPLPSAAGK